LIKLLLFYLINSCSPKNIVFLYIYLKKHNFIGINQLKFLFNNSIYKLVTNFISEDIFPKTAIKNYICNSVKLSMGKVCIKHSHYLNTYL